MKKPRNITIDDSLREKALIKAKKLGLNFSSYLCQLIEEDTKSKEDEASTD